MSTKIKSIIEWVQKPLSKVVSFLILKAKPFSKKMTHKHKLSVNQDRQEGRGKIGTSLTFGPFGRHRLWIEMQEASITVMVASKKESVKAKVQRWKKQLEDDDQFLGENRGKAELLLKQAFNWLEFIEEKGQQALRQSQFQIPNSAPYPPFTEINDEILQAQHSLAQIIKQLLELFVGTIRVGGFKYILDDSLFKKMLLTMNPLVSQTSLMAHYITYEPKYVQNQQKLFGKVIKNEYNRHAERVFIADYLPAILEEVKPYYETTSKKAVIFITLNRSSCGTETEHDCTGELVKIISNYKNILDVHLEFAAPYARAKEYSGSFPPKLSEKAKERIEQVLIRLLDAGAFVYATTLWRDLLQTEYFKSISSRTNKRQVLKYSIYEQILDDCIADVYASRANRSQHD